MATITKRGTGWYVQIRRKGFPAEFQTLPTMVEARAWARAREVAQDREEHPRPKAPQMTLGHLLERYGATVTPRKRSANSEAYRLAVMVRSSMGSVLLHDLRPAHIAAYRDTRLAQVKPGTVRRELTILRSAIEVAKREWGLSLRENPADQVRRPIVFDTRERRLRSGEWERLLLGVKSVRNGQLEPLIRLAVETALRRGELLKLSWEHIDLVACMAHIPDTKTGRPRTIPLTPEAIRILSALPNWGGFVFSVSATAIQQAWRRLCDRVGVGDLRFHDLRHEALSRFSELGLNTPELVTISGHKDVRMLLRYTHVHPGNLARKLASLVLPLEGRDA